MCLHEQKDECAEREEQGSVEYPPAETLAREIRIQVQVIVAGRVFADDAALNEAPPGGVLLDAKHRRRLRCGRVDRAGVLALRDEIAVSAEDHRNQVSRARAHAGKRTTQPPISLGVPRVPFTSPQSSLYVSSMIPSITTRGGPVQRTLRRRIVVALSVAGFVALAGGGWLAGTRLGAGLRDAAGQRLREDAHRAVLLVEQQLRERGRQAGLLGSAPVVVDAALEGARRARELGIVNQPAGVSPTPARLSELEARFNDTRTLGVSPRARAFLLAQNAPLDIAETILTDVYGYNAVTTDKSSDFVQSDEGWWQETFANGTRPAVATYDDAVRQVVVEVAAAVRERATDKPAGVLKIKFGITSMEETLAGAASVASTHFDIVDSAGRVVASTSNAPRMQPLPGIDALRHAASGRVISLEGGTASQRAAVEPLNGGAWRVVAHEDAAVLAGALAAEQRMVFGGLAAALAVLLGGLWIVSRFIQVRITAPVAELVRVSEAVASGDLSVTFTSSASDDEIGRLGRAIATMVRELSRLASEMHLAGTHTASYATSITQGAEGLSSSAEEIASTSHDLSQRVVDMAETIQRMSGDAAQMVAITTRMAEGAQEGVARNTRLRALAHENRARLDESATALDQLTVEVAESSSAIAALADASEGIRNFVTSVQKMSRQSRLLALNAAMEAARAGEQGEGFAVVANEVRRLAVGASDSAELTEGIVRGVLDRIERSRVSSARSVETLSGVRDATRHGLESFGHVEQAVADSEVWAAALAESAASSSELTSEMTQRLASLAQGAESFASAMQQVAATTEEQSASTQEIAAVAISLTESAERLRQFVTTFRLGA